MSTQIVREFYAAQVQREWRRLARDAYHRLEFDTTVHFLNQYLPAQGLVLDAGGGPGRYSLHLARHGYRPVLFDLTPENLAFAKVRTRRAGLQRQMEGFVEGSISDLSCFPDDSFDAVLCTGGPLSHLLDPHQRARAISELVRVAKPGTPIFVSVIGRLSVLVVILTRSQHELELPHFATLRETGDYAGGYGFTACHFFLPEELRAAFETEDVTILEMAGLQGLGSDHARHINQVARDERRWAAWLEAHLSTCTHPVSVGMSNHMLIVCRKNSGSLPELSQ